MHFDILVPDNVDAKEQIYSYGQKYLATKGQQGQTLASNECRFCHIEMATAEIEESVNATGYFIIEMQGC